MNVRPPFWAEAVLRVLLAPRDFETVSGDLLEGFRANVYPARGSCGANVWYVRQSTRIPGSGRRHLGARLRRRRRCEDGARLVRTAHRFSRARNRIDGAWRWHSFDRGTGSLVAIRFGRSRRTHRRRDGGAWRHHQHRRRCRVADDLARFANHGGDSGERRSG